MKTYRFASKMHGGGVARQERNFHNDRAARENAARLMKEDNAIDSIVVMNNGRKVYELERKK